MIAYLRVVPQTAIQQGGCSFTQGEKSELIKISDGGEQRASEDRPGEEENEEDRG